MSSDAVSFPFYRLSANAVKPGIWTYLRTGANTDDSKALGGGIESWDYNVDLDFQRKFGIDPQAVLGECRLREEAKLVVMVLASTAGQRIRKRVSTVEFTCCKDAGITDIELNFHLDGVTLQGDLRIDTEICVRKAFPQEESDPFTPTETGARIWSDSLTTALEGSLSRFPMSSVSFRQTFGNIGDAAWMLHWSPDALETNASSAIRMYLNTDSSLFNEIVSCNSVLCKVVQTDVLRQILVALIADPDFDLSPDNWPQYSLGNLAAQWASNIFGDMSAEPLRSRARTDPGWVDARIQSYMGLGNAG